MFRITIDENFWLMLEVNKLVYLDVQLINLGLLLIATVVFLRGKKIYKTRHLKKS
jgi:hypothetical protein